MDALVWILVVQLWTDNPPKVAMIHSKEYPNYQKCMEARKEWIERNLIALCGVKNNTNGK